MLLNLFSVRKYLLAYINDMLVFRPRANVDVASIRNENIHISLTSADDIQGTPFNNHQDMKHPIKKCYYIPSLRKPIRTIINNSYHISSMLLVASREIRTNISLGIYEARYDRKIARMVAQSILVGLPREAGVAQEPRGGGGRDEGETSRGY